MQVGSIVRVKENAYEGSDEPKDFEVRGKVGEIVADLYDDSWEVKVGNNWYILGSDELEEIEQSETVEPDTPQNREIISKIKMLINKMGWDTFEETIVNALDFTLVKDEDGERVYVGPDGEATITFSSKPAPNKSL